MLLAVLLVATTAFVNVMADRLEAATVLLLGAATVAATAVMPTTRHSLASHLLNVVQRAVLLATFLVYIDRMWLFAVSALDDVCVPCRAILLRLLPGAFAVVGIMCAIIVAIAFRLPTVGPEADASRLAGIRTRQPIAWLARILGNRGTAGDR